MLYKLQSKLFIQSPDNTYLGELRKERDYDIFISFFQLIFISPSF